MRRWTAAVGLGLLARAATAAEPFPFVMPLDDAARTVVDVGALNPVPIDAGGRLTVRAGRFVDAQKRRVRFLGVDVTDRHCFPPRDVAVKVAARLHKFGVNCVRLHHMDAGWAVPGIFNFKGESYGQKTDALDPVSLDRLDWFVYQLKLHGIYVDVNLHVSRSFGPQDGLPETRGLPEMAKVVGYFDPVMIERQKLYARQLLAHVNPYLGTRFVDDPVVAFVELTNEDSLLGSAGEALALPPHYRGQLVRGWNEWLKTTYGSTNALLKAWNADAVPLGPNRLNNPRNEDGSAGWTLETHELTGATLLVGPAAGPGAPPGKALRIAGVKPDGTGWHLQLHRAKLTLADGQRYTLSFAARADAPRRLEVNARLDEAPWSMIGLESGAALTPAWKRFRFTFVASGGRDGRDRISWVFGDSATPWEIADVALATGGGQAGLEAGESIEAGTVDLVPVSAAPPGADAAAYLMTVERAFAQGMRSFIRDDLGSPVPVLCSQAEYGGLGGVWRESRLDLVDSHAYWQHPGFPRKAWDDNDYEIGNTPMVRDTGGGTLTELSQRRVEGLPFTVSEYCHPVPSEWAAESVPEIFAAASLQDWDGVFLFCYDSTDLERERIDGFFDAAGDPNVMAFLPAAARMFLGGALPALPATATLVVPATQVAALASTNGWGLRNALVPGSASREDWLARRWALRFAPGGGSPTIERAGEAATPGPAAWISPADGAARFTVDAPAVKVAVGFLGGATVALDGFTLAVDRSPRDWACAVLVAQDGNPVPNSRSLLLTIVDKVENRGLEWNRNRTFARYAWSRGGPVAWPVAASVAMTTAARRAAVWRLDPKGRRAGAVAATVTGGRLSFRVRPEDRTLWYEIATEI